MLRADRYDCMILASIHPESVAAIAGFIKRVDGDPMTGDREDDFRGDCLAKKWCVRT